MIAHSVALDHNPNIGRYRYFITSCSTGIEALMRSKTVVVSVIYLPHPLLSST